MPISSPSSDIRGDEYDTGRTNDKPFRFKGSADPQEMLSFERNIPDSSHKRKHRHHHRHHRRHHKRRRLSDDELKSSSTSLDPDVAFRESLFDALGDDEGAEFWQGVYGQPIHTYPRNYEDADTGEIGLMDDEQYATYVRRKMWERSVEGMQAAREEKRRQQKEEAAKKRKKVQQDDESSRYRVPDEPEFLFDVELDASLKRGQHRKERKRWQQIWQTYGNSWKELQDVSESRTRSLADDVEQLSLRHKIAWPVESGRPEDVNAGNISHFMENIPIAINNTADEQQTKSSLLKAERVRWHPDKIQQRFGFMQIDQGTMESVTAVFQIIDQLWNEVRAKKSS